MIDDILAYNEKFVQEKRYEAYAASKYPRRKLAILSCMDTRLTKLLPDALGLKNGDAKIIKNAGVAIDDPFCSEVRSILVAIYELGVEEIMVIGHTDCGVQNMESSKVIEDMEKRGISEEQIALMNYCGVDFKHFLQGFPDEHDAIEKTVRLLQEHPLIPKDVKIYGFIMDTVTGKLERI